ncbi:MAG: hypothetical protein LBL04_16415 [Bacteroidales bacterium]|nr:hypothetical protein [Bacteroidales bacterium]
MNYSFGWFDYRVGVGDAWTSNVYEGDDFKSIAIEYSRQTAPNTEFCTGLTATVAYLVNTRHYSNYKDDMYIFSLPLHLKYHFLKYLFVEGGLNLNYNKGKGGYKFGAGLSANIGAEYVLRSGITFSASPFGQCNLLIAPIEHDTGIYKPSGMNKLFQWGVKLGIGYRF